MGFIIGSEWVESLNLLNIENIVYLTGHAHVFYNFPASAAKLRSPGSTLITATLGPVGSQVC